MTQQTRRPRSPVPAPYEVSEARFNKFRKDFESYEKDIIFERTQDAVLALYSQRKTDKSWELKFRIVCLLFELHRLCPGYSVDMTFKD